MIGYLADEVGNDGTAGLQGAYVSQEIVTQGKGGAGLFIVASGSAQAFHVRPDGSKALVNILEPTDFFGELALLSEGPRTATVVATEPTR